MKNKKGFTLIELLAVIAILAILAGIATPIVLTVRNNIKGKMFDTKVKEIKAAAVMCAEQNCPISNSNCDACDSVVELVCKGFLKMEKDTGGPTTSDCDNGKIAATNPTNDLNMRNCQVSFTKKANVRWEATWENGSWSNSAKNYVEQEACKKP